MLHAWDWWDRDRRHFMRRWRSRCPVHRSLRIGSRRLLLSRDTRPSSCESVGIHDSGLAHTSCITRCARLSNLVSEHGRTLLGGDPSLGLIENPLLLSLRDNGVVSCKSRVLSRRSLLRGVARVPVNLISHSLIRRAISRGLLHIRRRAVCLSVNYRRHRALRNSLSVRVCPKVGRGCSGLLLRKARLERESCSRSSRLGWQLPE
jgi:hypothetical protein